MIDFDISTICIGIIIFAVLTLIRKWYKNKKRYVFQILMFVYLMMVIEKTLFPIEFIDLEYNKLSTIFRRIDSKRHPEYHNDCSFWIFATMYL